MWEISAPKSKNNISPSLSAERREGVKDPKTNLPDEQENTRVDIVKVPSQAHRGFQALGERS